MTTTASGPSGRPRFWGKRRLWAWSAVAALVLLVWWGSLPDDRPTNLRLHFLEYTTHRTARFRMMNGSDDAVTFVGDGPASPQYDVSLHLADGWVAFTPDRQGSAPQYQVMQPDGVLEFEVPVINRRSPWKLAVLCHQGAPRFLRWPKWIGWLPYRVYDQLRRRPREANYVWSEVVPALESTPALKETPAQAGPGNQENPVPER